MRVVILQCFIVLLSIFQANAQNRSVKDINLEESINHYDVVKLSELATGVLYIPLKGCSVENLLNEIVYLDFSRERICVGDFQNCLLFNKNGILEKKIGRQGKGPGEYIHISGEYFSETGDFIYLSSGQCINKYSLDGKFIKCIHLPSVKTADGFKVPICPWFPLLDSSFLGNVPNFSGLQNNKLVVFDESGHIIKEFKNYQFYKNGFNMANTLDISTLFYKYGQLYTFKKLKNDTLFRMTKTFAIYPDYIFSFGKYRPPFENGYNSVKEFFREIVNYITLNSLLETKNYFFLTCDFGSHTLGYEITKTLKSGQNYTYKDTFVKGVYNKITGKITFLKPGQDDGLINDIDGGMNFYPKKILNDSILVSWVDAFQLKAYVASEAFKNSNPQHPEKKKELEKLANSLSENDNPVLMLVRLNE